MYRVKLMAFDLDGTLVESIHDLQDSVNYVLARFGLKPLREEEVRGFVGDGVRMLVARSLRAAGVETDFKLVDEALDIFRSHYLEHCLDTTALFPEVAETLEHFKNKILAVVTNKPALFARRILEGLGVAHYFSDILGDGNSNELKPDPWSLVFLLEKHDILPSEAVMVGDGKNDISAARRAGYKSCAVTYGNTKREILEELKPDFICDSFADLKKIFE